MTEPHYQIGEVAQTVGLSLRTIRFYEEVDLVPPSARTRGGFRLYTADDIDRLRLVKRMKPLDFSLEEMREILTTLDRLAGPDVTEGGRDQLQERLSMFAAAARGRCEVLRAQLDAAEEMAGLLLEESRRRRSARARS